MQEARDEVTISAAAPSREEKVAKEVAERENRAKEKKTGNWNIPKAVDGAEVKIPWRNVRVRVRRREGLPASKVPGRIG